jgi:energy-coupling factor transporter ATP-binding protein EcfA2
MKKIRVLVFGATGTGKTSLCNALTGGARPTDNGAKGITAKSHLYAPFTSGENRIEVIDTVGLHESLHGTVPAEQAVIELIELLNNARDGFSILVHVTRASRITKEHDDDFTFFVEKMAGNKIPVILAVTGCENEVSMADWVLRNEGAFMRFSYKKIIPTCFASGGPMESPFIPLRVQSREALLQSIHDNTLDEPLLLFGSDTGISFSETLYRLWNDFITLAGLPDDYRRRVNETAYSMMQRLGVPQAISDRVIQHIPDLVEELASKMPMPGAGKIARKISETFLKKIRGKSSL